MNLKVNNKLWLISDTHFGHKNVIQYSNRPINHEVIMLSNWIDLVKPEDQILHLGDVFLFNKGTSRRWAKVINLLPGEKFLIKGNHDNFNDEMYELAGFELVEEFIVESNKGHRIAVTHRPVSLEYPGPSWFRKVFTNIHGHCHGVPHRQEHDGTLLHDVEYIDVSVEKTEYAPVRLGNIFPI